MSLAHAQLRQLIDARKREELVRAGDKRVRLQKSANPNPNICQAVLGPFSANPGGVCGRVLKTARGCGLHPNG